MITTDGVYERAFTDAPIGMALVALDGRWLRVNRALCDLLGYTNDELMAATFQSITHSSDLARSLSNKVALLTGNISHFRDTKRYFHKSGRVIHVTLSVSLVRTSTGVPDHFITQIQDATQQRRADAERDMFFNLARDLFAVMTSDGAVTQANAAWKDFLGVEVEELLGLKFAAYLHPDDRGDSAAIIRSLAESGGTLQNRWKTSDGQYRWVEWSVGGTRDGHHYLVGRPKI